MILSREEFIEQFGDFKVLWLFDIAGITHVNVENDKASLYTDNQLVSNFRFTLHDNVYVKHGVFWRTTGSRIFTENYHYDKRHCENGPAIFVCNAAGVLVEESWWVDGKLHRVGNPANCRWYNDGQPWVEEWYLDGMYHREDGSAFTSWNEDGQIWLEQWKNEDKLHRVDGPAYLAYHDNGQCKYENYYVNGELHREDGPAWTIWNENDVLVEEKWYIHGVEFIDPNVHEEEAPENELVLEAPGHWEDAEPEFD
tara:strand:+ start:227 stop:988 length:762 start_codon:yes stop_codon:yes gene_type:complete